MNITCIPASLPKLIPARTGAINMEFIQIKERRLLFSPTQPQGGYLLEEAGGTRRKPISFGRRLTLLFSYEKEV